MLFNSLAFAVFFPLVVALFFALPGPRRWLLLMLASYLFYAWWKPEYFLLLVATMLIDYWAALLIERAGTPGRRRACLLASLAGNLGILFLFKYCNFTLATLRTILGSAGLTAPLPALEVLLPVGISFYTFQSMSYTIDVYRGQIAAERSFWRFSLFVTFFPQLVAGPIERSGHLLPQFRQPQTFEAARVCNGLQLMLWGFFKKLVVADRLAISVNEVYNQPHAYQGAPLLVATVLFAFQIYCDFSGYSDIAVGAARVLGFSLMRNFTQPYFSRSIGEFWKRWHISLSTWFRDYLYIPLGGNRVGRARAYANLLLTFLISGCWHGANWTFLIWGGLHGIFRLFEVWSAGLRARWLRWSGLHRWPRVSALAAVLLTFGLVNFSWIFFRANTLADAWYIVSHLGTGLGALLTGGGDWRARTTGLGLWLDAYAFWTVVSVGLLLLVEWQQRGGSVRARLDRAPAAVRWTAYYGMIILILFLGRFRTQEFIYFQF